MKKRMITLAVALMLMLSFASCGAGVDTATDIAKAETTTAAPTETTTAKAAVEVVTKADQPTTTAAATTAADKAQPTTKKAAAATAKKNNSAKSNTPAKATKKAAAAAKKNYEKWKSSDGKITYELWQNSDGTWTIKETSAYHNGSTTAKTKEAVDPRIEKTVKKSVLTKADYDWVLSEGISYIKSLPQAKIDSSASGYTFEGITAGNSTTREELLRHIKEAIDLEYNDFVGQGGIGMSLSLRSTGESYPFPQYEYVLRYITYLN